jgi:hypothetical protein
VFTVNRDDQEAEELFALERFRAKSGELVGAVSRGADPPDFVISDGDRTVTVEMTRYHEDSGRNGEDSPRARDEMLQRRLMTRAQHLFEAVHPDLYVRVSPFFRQGVLTKRNIQKLAERLAVVVADTMPPQPSLSEPLTHSRAEWATLNAARLDQAIVDLSIWRWGSMRRGQWDPTVSGIATGDVAHIESRVRLKEADLPSYKARADESWLIVYAPLLHASGFVDFEALRPVPLFMSSFDRVIFIDLFNAGYVAIA